MSDSSERPGELPGSGATPGGRADDGSGSPETRNGPVGVGSSSSEPRMGDDADSPRSGEDYRLPTQVPGDNSVVSGLRNPPAAIRGVGMSTLLLEAVVLLLALRPAQQLADATGSDLALIGVASGACVVGALLLRAKFGWVFGGLLQAFVVIVGVVVHWSIAVIGVLFGLIWFYVLRVRRTVLGSSDKPVETV